MRHRKFLSFMLISSLFSLITIGGVLLGITQVAAQSPPQVSNPVQPLSNGGLDPDRLLAPALDSKGTDFWLAFPANNSAGTLSLFITGDTTTTGVVEITGLSFNQSFTVTPGTITTVSIPSSADLGATSDAQVDRGIHVTALNEVTV